MVNTLILLLALAGTPSGTAEVESGDPVFSGPASSGAGSGDVVGPGSAVVDHCVARWDGTSGTLLQGSSLCVSDSAVAYLGVAEGGATASNMTGNLLDLQSSSGANAVTITAFGGAPTITGRRASGTQSSATAVSSGQNLFIVAGNGRDNAGTYSTNGAASIQMQTANAWTSTDHSTQIVFSTTPTGSTSTQTVLTLTAGADATFADDIAVNGGDVAINDNDSSTTPQLTISQAGAGDAAVQIVLSGSDGYAVGIDNDASGNPLVISASGTGTPVLGASNVLSMNGTGNVTQGVGTSTAAAGTYYINSYGGGNRAVFAGRLARNTQASPAATQANDELVQFVGRGYQTTTGDFTLGNAGFHVFAAENYTSTAQGAYLTLSTIAATTTTNSERVRILASGEVGVNDTGPDAQLDVNGSTADGSTNALQLGDSSDVAQFTADTDGNVAFLGGLSVGSLTETTTAGNATFAGDVTVSGGDFIVTGTATLGAGAWTLPVDTNVTLSGGVNGLSFDGTTLSLDATNDFVGFGTAAPSGVIHTTTSLLASTPLLDRTGATDVGFVTARFRAVRSGQMADGFGPCTNWIGRDADNVDNTWGAMCMTRSGADNSSTFRVSVANAGTSITAFVLSVSGANTGVATIGGSTSGGVQFDPAAAASIATESTTGAVSIATGLTSGALSIGTSASTSTLSLGAGSGSGTVTIGSSTRATAIAGILSMPESQSAYFRHVRQISATPSEPVACDANAVGAVQYVDDNDDGAAAQICACIAITDSTYDWRKADDLGTACSFY